MIIVYKYWIYNIAWNTYKLQRHVNIFFAPAHVKWKCITRRWKILTWNGPLSCSFIRTIIDTQEIYQELGFSCSRQVRDVQMFSSALRWMAAPYKIALCRRYRRNLFQVPYSHKVFQINTKTLQFESLHWPQLVPLRAQFVGRNVRTLVLRFAPCQSQKYPFHQLAVPL